MNLNISDSSALEVKSQHEVLPDNASPCSDNILHENRSEADQNTACREQLKETPPMPNRNEKQWTHGDNTVDSNNGRPQGRRTSKHKRQQKENRRKKPLKQTLIMQGRDMN